MNVRPGRSEWIAASRPRTLGAALSAVAVGVGVARSAGQVVAWRAVAALVVAVAMQVGTNFANDYSDGVRGADVRRIGPRRLVASGLAEPRAVRNAAWAAFFVAAAAGLALAVAVSYWLLLLGAVSIAAGWLYTGGPRPYGYAGLGELFVFIFFGMVAVVGTAYVVSGRVTAVAWVAAVPVGLLSVALLVVNNLRDIESDALASKDTLAVRLGERRTRRLYVSLIVIALLCPWAVFALRAWGLIALASVPLAIGPLGLVASGAKGGRLIEALGKTGALQLVFGALLAVGVAI